MKSTDDLGWSVTTWFRTRIFLAEDIENAAKLYILSQQSHTLLTRSDSDCCDRILLYVQNAGSALSFHETSYRDPSRCP